MIAKALMAFWLVALGLVLFAWGFYGLWAAPIKTVRQDRDMSKTVTETMRAGVYLSVIRAGFTGHADIPEGSFAAIVTVDEAWFTVDVAGNVRGDPEAVEREALALGISDNLMAGAAVGLARLALHRSRGP